MGMKNGALHTDNVRVYKSLNFVNVMQWIDIEVFSGGEGGLDCVHIVYVYALFIQNCIPSLTTFSASN